MSVNKVMLIGRLGNDINLKQTKTNSSVGSTSLCTTESFKNNMGEWGEKVEWHNLVFWGKSAEYAAKITKKGDAIYVEGKLQTSQYTGKNGEKLQRTDVLVKSFYIFPTGQKRKSAEEAADIKPDRSGEDPFDW